LAFSAGLPVSYPVKKTIFAHFCGGENIKDCEKTILKLSDNNIGTILDYSVEGEKNEKSFDATEAETIETVKRAAGAKSIPFSVFKVTGVAEFALLEKIQAGQSLSESEKSAWERARKRVDNICKTAHTLNVRIFIDAEETWIQKVIDDLAIEMMQKYNREKPTVYNTYQMYCHAKLAQLKVDFEKAQKENYFLAAKLVRGAYMEKERERAAKMGYEDPIQPDKAATDRDFDAALRFCVENKGKIAVCAGTHNENSSLLLAELMQGADIEKQNPDFYFAQLFGMSDHISYNLAAAGYNVAKYVPYGPVKSVMPYLFRRASENTSIAGQSSREFSLIKAEVRRRKI
jgi:proline dehydrogenase